MLTYSLDRFDWLRLNQIEDHRLRSQSYTIYFKGINDRIDANIDNENRLLSIAHNQSYFITRRDRDLETQDNRIESCTICFLYNASNKTIDIEISNINDIHGKFNRDTIRLFKIATLRHNQKLNRVLINNFPVHYDTIYNDHHICSVKDIKERLIVFVDDLQSIVCKESFMSDRQMKRQKYARLRSNRRSRRYKRLTNQSK